MTEQWKPEEIPKKVEGLLEALLQSAVLESDARLKVGTPVDTGRLRASWQIAKGEGNPSNPIDAGKNKQYGDTASIDSYEKSKDGYIDYIDRGFKKSKIKIDLNKSIEVFKTIKEKYI